ncbi:MAG: hypothetical protein QF552_09785 [Litorilituus sp.]|jgi:cell division protein FtsB|nr:hypothetical protein [Litorilituus sp.]
MSKKPANLAPLLSKYKTFLSHIKLPELGSGGLLVFQSGNFGLRAALFKADKHYATIKGFAESRQIDFTRAIAEIHQQLKKQHGSVPKRCLLISPSLVSAKLSLPVSPLKPKANGDMQELIRWEIDGAQSDDTKQWLIGSILVERGYLTNSQREEIVTELALRQDQGGEAAMTRFGDVAIELEYVSHPQLQECLTLQSKLVELAQDTVYSYQAEVAESSLEQAFTGLSDDVLSTDNDHSIAHQWLVSGLGQAIRKRWYGAFKLNGLKLEALYPSNGASFSALGLRSDADNQYLVEVHASHVVYLEGSNKNLKVIRTKARQDGNLSLAEVLAICPEHIANSNEPLYLFSPDDPLDELSAALAEHLMIEVRPLVQAPSSFELPKGVSSNRLLPCIGIANHYLKHSEPARACAVKAKDKEPPLWQKLLQPKVMMTMAAGFVFLAASGFIVWMQTNLVIQEQRLLELEQRWEKESKVKQQYDQVRTENKQRVDDIDNINNELALNNQLQQYLQKQLLPAAYTVPGALAAITESINQGVLIEKVELQLDSIVIDGRALQTRNASRFAQQLNDNLKPWHFQVGDTLSSAADSKTKDGVFIDYKMHLQIGRRYFIDEAQAPTTEQLTHQQKGE